MNDNKNHNNSINIFIHKIVYGTTLIPCHLFTSDSSDIVYFKTAQGLEFEYIKSCLYILFDDVHNVEYNPSTGNGCYISLDFTPKIGGYVFAE